MSILLDKTQKQSVDVLLLLEGTYPYVRGGVSSWVHQMITGLPQWRFGAVFIGSQPSDYGQIQYQLPDNLLYLETCYVSVPMDKQNKKARQGQPHAFAMNDQLHQGFKNPQQDNFKDTQAKVAQALGTDGAGFTLQDFLYSRCAWQQIQDYYERYCTDPSFIDYFWTVRTMHMPLFTLADIVDHLPKTRLLHSVSTGYAGFLGGLIHHRNNTPFIVSEHGIYTKERRLDLAQARWISDPEDSYSQTLEHQFGYIRQMWIRFFEGLGTMAYQAAAAIVALYESNSQQQQNDGAPSKLCQVIPNGIDLSKYQAVRVSPDRDVPPIVGLIGRVVPIKDIKSFIRSMYLVCQERPDAKGWIVGPTDEDREYAQECEQLISSLGLQNQVEILGFQNVIDILPQLGVVVLSSISEAQPLVVLEAFAAGIPVVATDVGSCRELLMGVDDNDQALGTAGALTRIANPAEQAQEIVKLLASPAQWRQMHQAGVARVDQYYGQKLMFDRYHTLYEKTLKAHDGQSATTMRQRG